MSGGQPLLTTACTHFVHM